MTEFQRYLVAVCFVVMAAGPVAFAGVKLSLVGVGGQTAVTATSLSNTFAAKLGMGGGALLEIPLGKRVGLEFCGLYYTRSWTDTVNSQTTTARAPVVEAPVGLRLWLGRAISLGAGGFLASGINKITRTDAAGTNTEVSFSGYYTNAMGLKTLDYGVYGSVGLAIPFGKSIAFLIDGRYQLGLSDQFVAPTGTTPLPVWTYSEMMGLVGFRFGSNK